MDTTPTPTPAPAERFVGIDVSKDRLDVALDGEPPFAVARTDQAVAGLVRRLAAAAPTLVVMAATGGLEALPAAALSSCLAGRGGDGDR